MIKVMSLLTRKEGMSREEFMREWVDVHAPMALSVPGLKRYVLQLIVEEPLRDDIPPQKVTADGIAELWFDDAAAMQKVLANPDNRAVDYIRSSLGTIASRNGGVNPFSGTFDVRLQKTFKTYKNQGFTLSVDAFNFANLLNKSWGVNYNLGQQNLLTATGFDQAPRRYSYRVNENVGTTNQNGTPYQIQLGARYSF